MGNICNFSDNEEVLYSICRYRDISVMETPAGKTEGEKPVKNITDMSLMVWARGGVQWASGLPFSRVCFNSAWDFNSVSCFNLPRTILRGFVIKSTKSSCALFLTLQQNTGLCQNKNNAKYHVHFMLHGLCIYTCFTYMDWTVTATTSTISVREWYGRHDTNTHQHPFAT